MKKLLVSIFILISTLALFPLSCFANSNILNTNLTKEEFLNGDAPTYEEISKLPGSKTVNEYDKFLEQVKNLNYFDLKLYKQRYKEKIKEYANSYDKITLETMGFDSKQINAIYSAKNLRINEISDEIARKASADFSIYLSKNWEHHDEISMICYWAWSKAPFWGNEDILAFSTTHGLEFNPYSSTMKVTYSPSHPDIDSFSRRFSPIISGDGCYFAFDQAGTGFRDYSSGKAYMVAEKLAYDSYYKTVTEYHHSTSSSSLSVSIYGLGISINGGSILMGSDYLIHRQ